MYVVALPRLLATDAGPALGEAMLSYGCQLFILIS